MLCNGPPQVLLEFPSGALLGCDSVGPVPSLLPSAADRGSAARGGWRGGWEESQGQQLGEELLPQGQAA